MEIRTAVGLVIAVIVGMLPLAYVLWLSKRSLASVNTDRDNRNATILVAIEIIYALFAAYGDLWRGAAFFAFANSMFFFAVALLWSRSEQKWQRNGVVKMLLLAIFAFLTSIYFIMLSTNTLPEWLTI